MNLCVYVNIVHPCNDVALFDQFVVIHDALIWSHSPLNSLFGGGGVRLVIVFFLFLSIIYMLIPFFNLSLSTYRIFSRLHLSNCPWARQWTPNCSQWSQAAPCMVAATHWCVSVSLNGWMRVHCKALCGTEQGLVNAVRVQSILPFTNTVDKWQYCFLLQQWDRDCVNYEMRSATWCWDLAMTVISTN